MYYIYLIDIFVKTIQSFIYALSELGTSLSGLLTIWRKYQISIVKRVCCLSGQHRLGLHSLSPGCLHQYSLCLELSLFLAFCILLLLFLTYNHYHFRAQKLSWIPQITHCTSYLQTYASPFYLESLSYLLSLNLHTFKVSDKCPIFPASTSF